MPAWQEQLPAAGDGYVRLTRLCLLTSCCGRAGHLGLAARVSVEDRRHEVPGILLVDGCAPSSTNG